MAEKFQRLQLFRTNKFQKILILPIVVAFIFGCAVSWLSLSYFFLNSTSTQNPTLIILKQIIPYLLIIFTFLMLVVFLWSCYKSNKFLGPFERVLAELDQVLEGKKKGPIHTRDGDELFAELLKRINKLIEKI